MKKDATIIGQQEDGEIENMIEDLEIGQKEIEKAKIIINMYNSLKY